MIKLKKVSKELLGQLKAEAIVSKNIIHKNLIFAHR